MPTPPPIGPRSVTAKTRSSEGPSLHVLGPGGVWAVGPALHRPPSAQISMDGVPEAYIALFTAESLEKMFEWQPMIQRKADEARPWDVAKMGLFCARPTTCLCWFGVRGCGPGPPGSVTPKTTQAPPPPRPKMVPPGRGLEAASAPLTAGAMCSHIIPLRSADPSPPPPEQKLRCDHGPSGPGPKIVRRGPGIDLLGRDCRGGAAAAGAVPRRRSFMTGSLFHATPARGRRPGLGQTGIPLPPLCPRPLPNRRPEHWAMAPVAIVCTDCPPPPPPVHSCSGALVPDFVRNVFGLALDTFPQDRAVLMMWLEWEAAMSVDDALAKGKELLQRHRTDVVLWVFYAQLLHRNRQFDRSGPTAPSPTTISCWRRGQRRYCAPRQRAGPARDRGPGAR